MANRNMLRNQIIEAWTLTMAEAYPLQLVNSERGLQVHFCHRLLEQFHGLQRRLFIEPTFSADDGSVRCPDVVVCNNGKIIGVIELKYRPRTTPGLSKDIETLNWFANAKNPVLSHWPTVASSLC